MNSGWPGSDRRDLIDLLSDCTVRVVQKTAFGTGFFVAPGLVLTCAHLVDDGDPETIRLLWKDQELRVKAVQRPGVREAPGEVVSSAGGVAEEPPDLALLEIEETTHPCVLLHGEVTVSDSLYSYGFPGALLSEGRSRGDPVTTEFEGFTAEPRLLKFKQGQIQFGHSGSPILNLRTGAVCGLVSWTRGELHIPSRLHSFIVDLGGLGEPTETILASYPQIALLNTRFHAQDGGWMGSLSREQRRALEDASGGSRGRWKTWPAAVALLTPALLAILVQPGGDRPASLYGPWELFGPAWAFVQAIGTDPRDPQTVYAALGEGQGVFRSDDGGLTWKPRNVGLARPTVMDIAVSQHDGTVYAATRNGLWISRDRGETWTSGDPRYRGKELLCLALSPHDPKFLLVGTLKPGGISITVSTVVVLSGPGPKKASTSVEAGHLHITRNDGQTWSTFPLETVNDASVAFADSRITYIASADEGLFRTQDGFETIERVERFPDKQPLSVAIAPHDSGTILVGTLHSGLYRSFDGGESWDKVGLVGDVQVSQVTFSLTDSQHVLAATRSGVFESQDGGRTWRATREGLAYHWVLPVATTKDGVILAGASGGGVYRRVPGQKNWIAHNEGFPPAAGWVLAEGDPSHLFAGTPVGLFGSRDAGATWKFLAFPGEAVTAIALPRPWKKTGPSGGGLHISFDQGQSVQDSPMAGKPSLKIYAGTLSGRVYRSGDAGSTWTELARPQGKGEGFRSQLRALVVAAGAPDVLYVSLEHQGILRSTDGGVTWAPIGEDVCGTAVNVLFLSPHDPRVLYAATVDRGLCVSLDGGDTWQPASGLGGEPMTGVIEPSQVPRLAFATGLSRAVYRSRDQGLSWEVLRPGDRDPRTDRDAHWATLDVSADGSRLALGSSSGAWLSRNGGESWKPLGGGILGFEYHVNALFFDTEDADLLYAAMSLGIFRMALGE